MGKILAKNTFFRQHNGDTKRLIVYGQPAHSWHFQEKAREYQLMAVTSFHKSKCDYVLLLKWRKTIKHIQYFSKISQHAAGLAQSSSNKGILIFCRRSLLGQNYLKKEGLYHAFFCSHSKIMALLFPCLLHRQ